MTTIEVAMSDLVERLRNPLWAHSKAPFESPQLDKDGALADMAEAATALEAQAKELAALRGLLDEWEDRTGPQLMDRAETAEQQVKAQRDFMKELSDALISIRPLGGSELFVKRFDEYFADPAYCKAAIEQRSEAYHEAMKESVRNRKRAETAERRLNGLIDYVKSWTSPATMRLQAGEMSAQEVRTVQAILSAVLDHARAARAITGKD